LLPSIVDRSKPQGGPRVSFNTSFAQPGFHRIWSQFQRNEEVITVSFDIIVSRLDRIGQWDGESWSSLVSNPINGLNGPVRCLAVNGTDVYVGGDFTSIDGRPINRIARWDGHSWSDLNGGVNGSVWAIAFSGSGLVVAGDFTSAGGKPMNRIARWDGQEWSPLGPGVGGRQDDLGSATIYALAVMNNNIYAGGRFARAGDTQVNGIARWDGKTWTGLGEGVRTGIYEGVVRVLAIHKEDLYVGGQFMMAGDITAHNIARWTGNRWFSLGEGVRGNLEQVLAMSVSGNDLYVGGVFTTAGGVLAPNLAKWDGGNWSPVPVEPADGVQRIFVDGNNIYLGGNLFTLPTGILVRGIARWDGRSWSGLGNGIRTESESGPVMAIAKSGKNLYIGGEGFALPHNNVRH
jgi:hypothetical protein